MEKTGCKIICGAPTTLAVKGLMLLLLLLLMMSCFPTIMTYSMLVPYHYVSYLCSASFIGDVKFTFPYDLSSGATPTSCICLHPSSHNPRRCTQRCAKFNINAASYTNRRAPIHQRCITQHRRAPIHQRCFTYPPMCPYTPTLHHTPTAVPPYINVALHTNRCAPNLHTKRCAPNLPPLCP